MNTEANIVDNQGRMFAEGVPLNLPSSTSALNGPKRTGKCNLRKSLAWDSAFFTNAGMCYALYFEFYSLKKLFSALH